MLVHLDWLKILRNFQIQSIRGFVISLEVGNNKTENIFLFTFLKYLLFIQRSWLHTLTKVMHISESILWIVRAAKETEHTYLSSKA